jgi:hypothetical protein
VLDGGGAQRFREKVLVSRFGPAWFETRSFAALLTMRITVNLILSLRSKRLEG